MAAPQVITLGIGPGSEVKYLLTFGLWPTIPAVKGSVAVTDAIVGYLVMTDGLVGSLAAVDAGVGALTVGDS